MMRFLASALWLCLCAFLPIVLSKYVSVNLDAKWKHTPLVLEASEFLAKESNDKFWHFANAISEMKDFQTGEAMKKSNDEHQYLASLKIASHLISPLQLNLLKFSLALRANSPTVEMFNELSKDKSPPAECEVFVEVNSIISCEIDALGAFIKAAAGQPKPMLIKSDHHYPGTQGRPVMVILYAQLATPAFHQWHEILRKRAEDGEINYIFRHYIKESASHQVRLSGYGVELAIKSTEYKAKDDSKVEGQAPDSEEDTEDVEGFMFGKLKKLHPELNEHLTEFQEHLRKTSGDIDELKVWQLQDLSFQAAQRVLMAPEEEALATLREISQNFPIAARSLAGKPITDELRKEVKKNQDKLQNSVGLMPGDNAMFINGLQADLEVYDVFTLLDHLKAEAKLMEGIHHLAKQYSVVDKDEMSGLLKLDINSADSTYAIDIRDDSVVYLNNIETDRKYASWPASVQELLRPTFPGMLRHIRKNLFHLTFFVNPADPSARDLLKMAEAFYVHNAPARIGLVLVVNSDPEVDPMTDAGVAMYRAFNYIKTQDSPAKALSFITDIYDKYKSSGLAAEHVVTELREQKPKADVKKVFGVQGAWDKGRKESVEFFKRTGLTSAPQVLINGVPMKASELTADEFEEAAVTAILKATPDLQKATHSGHLNDRTDTLDFLMTRGNVMPRLNARILNPTDHFLDFSEEIRSYILIFTNCRLILFTFDSAAATMLTDLEAFQELSPGKMASAVANGLKYLAKKDEDAVRPVTMWIIADLESPEGRSTVYDAIKQMKTTNNIRFSVVHNPSEMPSPNTLSISRAVQAAISHLPVSTAKSFITKLVKEDLVKELESGSKTLEDLAVGGMDFDDYAVSLEKLDDKIFHAHRLFCEKAVEMKPGQIAVIANGRVLGPLTADENFIQADFALLEKFTHQQSAGKIHDKIKKLQLDQQDASDLTMKADALLSSVPQKESRKEVKFKAEKHSVLKISALSDGPAYEVVVVMDPTTRAAQKYTPLIEVLQQVTNVDIKIFFNCREKLSEMPLKSFYRYVLEPEVLFSADKSLASGPGAFFKDMPSKPILTLGMDPPESWLVESVKTHYDLDNIHLEEVERGVDSNFELEYLLLEGHCYDSQTGQPPRGLQYTLGTKTHPDQVDTIVMANLGYFQLKAKPGAWFLKLRHGRSEEIYDIISHEYTDSHADSDEVIVVMDTFKSKIIRVKVSKKPGMEMEDLLSESGAQADQGLWDSISSSLTGGTKDESEDKDETLNIFSLASGHLYERFLRIMMTSVLKHTKSRVKFWFLKNYLSPSFKDFIPHMAKEYDFDYELVQYKWPRWLHQQKEKQRIIWGYKILFLDVLFPLNINKIIFVDADQIVRADLQELADFDLEGAPYGYTPFCDSRKEMDGFRFWKSGYWASHLAGRKYHISALYVVDLKKFRRIAAGDRLRGQYQGLSQDPNSLSNLDQDLPNNMIHQVAIKSLPQEWLFCETWCSDAELEKAKTIDLCNNPLTKEPKLSAAQRIVPEWTDYDQQIKSLWDTVYSSKKPAVSSGSSHTSGDTKDRDEL
ncbi:hypothetical protein CAPTEDRAFT_227323 [Capitella teleta]|uniref:UDP-glucose:glycoprotein glucosyltransferase 1 n=1 Tax=Capitella teleta TaxID=283909 RepID=R7V1K9_CAPTE|nr:hypothetical protein CAPTEDRAFT_227323 [Capitella teleta]|eukprot:ELU12397.1 hypothetical protein CAPTEDRAFT_227323 [Capitella teleta]